jgi:hypothetical protein
VRAAEVVEQLAHFPRILRRQIVEQGQHGGLRDEVHAVSMRTARGTIRFLRGADRSGFSRDASGMTPEAGRASRLKPLLHGKVGEVQT